MGNDLQLAWIRRTRTGGDSWFGQDVPLGEMSEKYQVELLDGSNILFTQLVNEPELLIASGTFPVIYPQGLPAQMCWRVAQLSETYGVGEPADQFIIT